MAITMIKGGQHLFKLNCRQKIKNEKKWKKISPKDYKNPERKRDRSYKLI